MRSELHANEQLAIANGATPQDPFSRAAVRLYRQVDDCYRISHPIASRGLLARLWASLVNWL